MAGPEPISYYYAFELLDRFARQRIAQGPAKHPLAALVEPPVLQARELLPSHASGGGTAAKPQCSRAARCRPSSGAVCGSPKVGALSRVSLATLSVTEPGSPSAMASTGTRRCFLPKPITPPVATSMNR